MPKIKFIDADKTNEDIEVSAGTSIMHAAVAAGIDGIVGECGGSAMCATCHVYVAIDDQLERGFPPISAVEDAMLDSAAAERTDESRLSCQLPVKESYDGLQVRLPERQI